MTGRLLDERVLLSSTSSLTSCEVVEKRENDEAIAIFLENATAGGHFVPLVY